jgi:hypothetical protein
MARQLRVRRRGVLYRDAQSHSGLQNRVKPQNKKYFALPEFCFAVTIPAVLHPFRRDAAHRHVTLGAGCDGRCKRRAGLPPDETPVADGEVVWSWRRDPGVDPPRPCGDGNGDNKGRSPGRARNKP